MIKIVVVVCVALLVVSAVGVVVYATTKPDTFAIERSVTIKAAPEKIFPLINDLGAQATWSPFEKDPAMKRILSGPQNGKGATYEWDGNSEVGKGRIVITESAPPSRVALALDMVKPFEAHNIVVFTLTPDGSATRVTWAMRGAQPFIAKLVSTFIDCEKMVGKEFESGLANLKVLAEQ